MDTEGKKDKELDADIDLFDLFIALVKRKRFISCVTLAVAMFALTVTLVLTPAYQGSSKVLVSQNSSSASALASQLAGAASVFGLSVPTSSPVEMFAALVISRTILDKILDRFHLMEPYRARVFLGNIRNFTRDDARDILTGLTTITPDATSGLIDIQVEDYDAQQSCDMTNAFVEELQNLVNGLAVTEAGKRRVFFEGQLKSSQMALAEAEVAVQKFQQNTGALYISDQAKAIMDAIAALEAQVIAKEIELKVMKTYATQQNPDVKRNEEALLGLKDQLKTLEAKRMSNPVEYHPNIVIPTGDIPELATEFIRLQREFKFQETLHDVLVKQYETARLDEARESSPLQLVDKSVVPEKVFTPKIPLVVVIATGMGFFLALFLALVVEYFDRVSRDFSSKAKRDLLSSYMGRK
jgi:tyrosine-protein kinase Etk/Wzc